MAARKLTFVILALVCLVGVSVVVTSAAQLNVYGHYEFNFEWTPKGKIRSHHDVWIGAAVESGPLYARFRLTSVPWWQLQHLQTDFAFEEVRVRWTDRLYRSGQPFEMFAGHRVGVNWDPIGFHASEPGIGFEGLNLWGFRLNGLFAVLDDYNQTTDSYNIAGLQVQRRVGNWNLSALYAGNARWASEADQSGARYIIHPPKEFNTVYLVRFNGGVGFLPADVDGWVGVHALQTAGAAPQHVPAYEVNVNYALREDITVKAGYRDYPAEFDPPYAKRDESSDPIRAYRGQVGGYGQVDFKVNWPVGQPSDLSVRLEQYVQRDTAKPDTDVTYGKVDWRVAGYEVAAGYRTEKADGGASRDVTDLSVAKSFYLGAGELESKYTLGLEHGAGQSLTHKHKVELKLKPQSLLWSGVKPRAILEMQGTEEGLETVVRVGARYDTVNGLWAEVEFALSEDHAIRNESYVKLGYRSNF